MRAGGLAALCAALVLSGCQSLLVSTPEHSFQAAQVDNSSDSSATLVFPEFDTSVSEIEAGNVLNDPVSELIGGWSLEQKISSLFISHISGTSVADFETAASAGLSGFLILRSNVPGEAEESRPFLASVRELGEPDLLIAIDQEGGAVGRLRPDPFPSPSELGELEPAETTDATSQRNQLVFDSGANVNLGVIADVSPGESAFIHERSFGDTPELVADYVVAALDGSVEGVASAVKHFPGHGLTTADTHEGAATANVSYDTWLNNHALPFQTAIDADVPIVMFGHLIVGEVDSLPASLSPAWVELVREQWAYSGVLVTDDLAMLENSADETYSDFATNARLAVAAGMDLIIDAGGTSLNTSLDRIDRAVAEIADAVESGAISQAQIDQSAYRVVSLRSSLGGVSRPLENTEAG
jgi:beta-N-acetylhexosaminidase